MDQAELVLLTTIGFAIVGISTCIRFGGHTTLLAGFDPGK